MHWKISGSRKRHFEKDRLYVGLYARDGEVSSNDVYQWALIVGPKADEPSCLATSYSARVRRMTTLSGRQESRWAYYEGQMRMSRREGLVARVMLGKVRNTEKLASILRRVPMRPEVQDWDSVAWVKEGLADIEKDGKCLGTSVTHWRFVRDAALQVAQNDAARRIEHGEPEEEQRDIVPTFDMLLKRET